MFIRRFTLLLAILISSVGMSACAAAGSGNVVGETQVLALQAGETVRGISRALVDSPGTKIFMKNDLITFAWPIGEGWGFTMVDALKRDSIRIADQIRTVGGNFVNFATMSELAKFLVDCGWKEITSKEVPLSVVEGTGHVAAWLKALAGSLTTIIIVPANVGDGFLDGLDIYTGPTDL